jgi:hypothetical protein
MTFFTLNGSWDLSRASFYLARFASSQGAQYKIKFVASMIESAANPLPAKSLDAEY